MKYCVKSKLRFETPAKRDGYFNSIKVKLDGKSIWGELGNFSGQDMQGFPSHSLLVRFDSKGDMDELFALIKERMEHIPVLKGTVSKHDCSHDIGRVPCVISERFEK